MQPQEKNPYRVEQTTSLTGGFDFYEEEMLTFERKNVNRYKE